MTSALHENLVLSIIIPTFGRAQLLHSCLDSFRTLKCAFEVIVVDDGSYLPIAIDIKDYAFQIKLVRHPKNLGRFEAIKSGSVLASGLYVMLFDSDDLWVESGEFEMSMNSLFGDIGLVFFTSKTSYRCQCEKLAANYFKIRYQSDIKGDLKEVISTTRFREALEHLGLISARRVPTTLIWLLAYSGQNVALLPHIICRKEYLSNGMTKQSLKNRLLDPYPMYLLYLELVKCSFETKAWLLLGKFGIRLIFYRIISVKL